MKTLQKIIDFVCRNPRGKWREIKLMGGWRNIQAIESAEKLFKN